MSKSSIFFVLLSAFIAGIFWRSFFEISQYLYFIIPIIFIIIGIVFYDKNILIISFAFLFLIIGAWKTDIAIENSNKLTYLGKNLQENVLIIKSIESSFGQNIIVYFQNENIFVLIKTPEYPEYSYGDKINSSCELKAIENLPAQDQGKDVEFDYRMYMAKDGVLYQCDKPKIQKLNQKGGSKIYEMILKIRESFEQKIKIVIPQPEGALADGLLFGGSSELSKEIQNDFSKTGMTHIVAVSGYNVTIIAEYLILFGIFLGMWRRQAIWFAIVGIILFVIMSGLPASAVRAGVMGTVLLWAMKNGRLTNAQNAIIFAGAIMLFLNPLLLRWDIGFQLSFLATLGIVETSVFWEKSFIKKHKAFGISQALALSLSAQIFVLPIIAYNFHITSLVSLLANVFILPIIPLSMLLVLLVSVFGFIFYPLSLVFAWLAYALLLYEISLIHILAQFPWASIQTEDINVDWIIIYYAVLCFGVFMLKRSNKISNSEF